MKTHILAWMAPTISYEHVILDGCRLADGHFYTALAVQALPCSSQGSAAAAAGPAGGSSGSAGGKEFVVLSSYVQYASSAEEQAAAAGGPPGIDGMHKAQVRLCMHNTCARETGS